MFVSGLVCFTSVGTIIRLHVAACINVPLFTYMYILSGNRVVGYCCAFKLYLLVDLYFSDNEFCLGNFFLLLYCLTSLQVNVYSILTSSADDIY